MGKINAAAKRTAVITGAGTGIGKATTRALADEGFELLLCGRRLEPLEALKREVTDSGAKVYMEICDVSVEADVRAMAAEAGRHWGHVDVLFNNAGSGKVLPLEESSIELWNETVGSSLTGTFLCCREFMPLLRAAAAGLIINNASVAARRGFAGFAAYSAAKGGVAAFSAALREELRPAGVRVSTLFIGATDSPFWEGVAGEWDRGRMMTCEDIGRIIAQIAATNGGVVVEEINLMPVSGTL
jgi:NADP-dependent 3-hydroxy acid dehydrogenase YdfG